MSPLLSARRTVQNVVTRLRKMRAFRWYRRLV
jgi:hypothetical protein